MAAIAFMVITNSYGQEAEIKCQRPESEIFMDLGSLIYGNSINLTIGHGLGSRWSVYTCTQLSLNTGKASSETEEEIHQSELGKQPWAYAIMNSIMSGNSLEAGVKFWTHRNYDGFYFSLGYMVRTSTSTACVAGTGICIHIWKGISAEAEYSKIIYNTEKMSDRLRIGVGYTF